MEIKPKFVVEQRVSNLAQGLLTLGTMTGPLLTVLHLVPHGVLAGLFFIMGFQALEANGITEKLLFLLRDKNLTNVNAPLRAISTKATWKFVAIELVGFGATFAITQTVAAVGFPVFIFILIPIRTLLMPKWFTPKELSTLDEPTASEFTMESCGGTYGDKIIEGEGNTSESDDGEFSNGSGMSRHSSRVQAENGPYNEDSSRAARSDAELAEEGLADSLSRRHHHS